VVYQRVQHGVSWREKLGVGGTRYLPLECYAHAFREGVGGRAYAA
jgi:hypothetical protein